MTALPSAIANVLHQALRYRNYPRPCPTPPSLRKEPLQPRLWSTSTASASRHALFTIAHVLWPYRVTFNCYICDTHQAHASKKIEDGEQEACSVYSPSFRRCCCCTSSAVALILPVCRLSHVDRKQCAAIEQLLAEIRRAEIAAAA